MVIQELIRVIQASIGNMKRYPKLRHEIESVMCNFIRETEQNCKDHVRMLINCELAYINVGNGLDLSSGKFKAPVAGTYAIHFNALLSSFLFSFQPPPTLL